MRLLFLAAGLFLWQGAVTRTIMPPKTQSLDAETGTGDSPVILSLRPSLGAAKTLVTVSGRGFTPTAGFSGSPNGGADYGGNTVRLGSDVTLKNVNSADGLTLRFDIPETIAPGVYGLTIVNQNGTSNSVNLTVTASPR